MSIKLFATMVHKCNINIFIIYEFFIGCIAHCHKEPLSGQLCTDHSLRWYDICSFLVQ